MPSAPSEFAVHTVHDPPRALKFGPTNHGPWTVFRRSFVGSGIVWTDHPFGPWTVLRFAFRGKKGRGLPSRLARFQGPLNRNLDRKDPGSERETKVVEGRSMAGMAVRASTPGRRSETRTFRWSHGCASVLLFSMLAIPYRAEAKNRHERKAEREARSRTSSSAKAGRGKKRKDENKIIQIDNEDGFVLRINTKAIKKKATMIRESVDDLVNGKTTWKAHKSPRRTETVTVQTVKDISARTKQANWVFLSLAATILFFMFKDKINWRLASPFSLRRQRKGRVVRDRSLGGKEVHIAPLESSFKARAADSPLQEVLEKERKVESSRRLDRTPLFNPPSWWVEPPTSVASLAQKRSAEMQANALLRSMLDARLLGADFPTFSLVEFEGLCSSAGITINVEPANSREALFRSGLHAAIEAAVSGSSVLGGKKPPSFICGLAVGIGLDRNRAATLIKAGVASKCRSILLNCAAQMRREESGDVLLSLMHVDSLLDVFTPEVNAPETEVLAAGLISRISQKERATLLETYQSSGFRHLDLFAELVGLDSSSDP